MLAGVVGIGALTVFGLATVSIGVTLSNLAPSASEVESDRPTVSSMASQVQTPAGEALIAVAEATGESVIACDLPLDLPPGDVLGELSHIAREGQQLLALVPDSAGYRTLRLYEPWDGTGSEGGHFIEQMMRPPRATARYTFAVPGHVGKCAIEDPEPVVIRGQVVDRSGQPIENAVVAGCSDTDVRSGPDGRFEIYTHKGRPCDLRGGPSIETWNPPEFVELIGPLPDEPTPLELKEELEALRSMASPYEAALEDADLSSEARSILEEWRDRDAARAADLERAYAALTEMANRG